MKIAAPAAALAAALLLCGCLKSNLPELGETPAFELTGEDGQTFKSADQLANNVWVADFIFTTCHGPCPRMTSQLHKVQEATDGLADVQLVSFTVDPANDTPERLLEYARQFHYDPSRWHFLTGSPASLQKLSMDTFHLGDTGAKLEHSTRFVLVDRRGRIRGYYDTSDSSSIPQLIEDIGKLRKEVL